MSRAMVSAQLAVMGWPSPGRFWGSSGGTELPCSPRPQLQAFAGSPTRPQENSLSARRAAPCDSLAWGCDGLVALGGVFLLAPAVCGPGCRHLEKPWGAQAGVPGEQSEENPKAVGEPWERGAVPEPPEPGAAGAAPGRGFSSQGLRPPGAHQPWPDPQPWPAGSAWGGGNCIWE